MPRSTTMVLALTMLIATPANAQTYSGGLEKVTEILNTNPQIPREQADAIHEKSVSLRASADRINEYCEGNPSAARAQRCEFARGIFFNSVVRLLQRAHNAEGGIYETERIIDDPRCAVAKRFNDPSMVPEGVPCEF